MGKISHFLFVQKVVLLVATALLGGCTSFYFEEAQPTNGKRLKKFPKAYRGKWQNEEWTIDVHKSTITAVEKDTIYLTQSEIDSSAQFQIKDNLLYYSEAEDPDRGFRFSRIKDTLEVYNDIISKYEIGDSTYYTSSGEYYFLNYLDEDGWWQVFLLDTKQKDQIIMRYMSKYDFYDLDENDDAPIKLFDYDVDTLKDGREVNQSKHEKYFEGGFTSKQINTFINKGGFSDTVIVFKRTHE